MIAMVLTGRLNGLNDPYCRFYTNQQTSALLVSLMQPNAPKKIVDLGAGGGALSFSAHSKWNKSQIVTVDIDEKCAPILKQHFSQVLFKKHIHHVGDALDIELPNKLLSNHQKFDAAICNPPYIQLEWKEEFCHILKEAGFTSLLKKKSDVTIDALFLAQNIRLVKDGGQIGLLIPDSIITGYRMADLRKIILNDHHVDSVVQLPRGSFAHTDAQAYILILNKLKNSNNQIKLMKFDNQNGLSDAIIITADLAAERMDYSFYAESTKAIYSEKATLEDLKAEIVRGSLSSADVKKSSNAIFHTTNFPKCPGEKISFHNSSKDLAKNTRFVIAQKGDILLARVDRSLHLKVTYIQEGQSLISDCVYRIRVQAKDRNKVLRALSSNKGRDLLLAASHGVSARVLSKRDLLSIPIL